VASVPQSQAPAKGTKWMILIFLGLVVLGSVYWIHSREEKKEGEENLVPPSIWTGLAAEVTGTSALLTATIYHGDYQMVDVCFRWREVGGAWNYVPWKRNFTGLSCGYRLNNLSPGKTYEFQALLRYDGKEVVGEIKSFTTPLPGRGMNMTATVRGVYFPHMFFTARLTPENKVLLTVQSAENAIEEGDWEWRAENASGPVGPYVLGTGRLDTGVSLTLDVSVYVRAGVLKVGDYIRIRHKPSTFSYRVTISP